MGAHHRPTVKAIAGPWAEDAACRSVPTRWFFPTTEQGEERALALCRSCPVRDECQQFSISSEQWHGVWGGLTERERRRLIRRQRRQQRESVA